MVLLTLANWLVLGICNGATAKSPNIWRPWLNTDATDIAVSRQQLENNYTDNLSQQNKSALTFHKYVWNAIWNGEPLNSILFATDTPWGWKFSLTKNQFDSSLNLHIYSFPTTAFYIWLHVMNISGDPTSLIYPLGMIHLNSVQITFHLRMIVMICA